MKLPKNYVPGLGVQKATAFGGIGQRLMEKQGWQKGEGLGKGKSGMLEALEVKEKKDTLGVGATGGWDWSQKFWEDAYNTAASTIPQGEDSSSSDSESEDEAAKQRKSNSKSKAKGKRASKKKPSSSDDSSSSSDSSSDSDVDARGRSKSKSPATNRDGTYASAPAAELAIAAELAKDPWGRWGGKAGKMARIKQQEEQAAARAREKLGLPPEPVVAPAKSSKVSTKVTPQPEAEQQPKKRIIITLTLPEDLQPRLPFVPTPATGWWGAGYFVSAGAMESVEKQEDAAVKERKTFNEDDQANLYMQAHEAQRVGRKGLGKSTTVNIAGGKWEGSRKTFADDDDEQQQQQGEAEANQAAQQQELAGAGSDAAQAEPSSGKQGKQGKKRAVETADEAGSKKRRKKGAGSDGEEEGGEAEAEAGTAKPIKWLKVAKTILKQAPKGQLKLKKLCKELMKHVQEHYGKHGGMKHSYSHDDISSLLHKKAKKSKVLIEDGFVRLPA